MLPVPHELPPRGARPGLTAGYPTLQPSGNRGSWLGLSTGTQGGSGAVVVVGRGTVVVVDGIVTPWGSVVDDDVLEFGVRLRAYALDRVPQVPSLVEGRRHDRDEGHAATGSLTAGSGPPRRPSSSS